MIPVEELDYELKLAINKAGREDNNSVSLPNRLIYLNNAQISWIKNKINPNNTLRSGYESIRKRIDDLQIIKVDDLKLSVKKVKDSPYNPYHCSLKDISDYMMYVTSTSKAKLGDCEEMISNDEIRSGDLKTYYYDTNYTPSFIWRTTLMTVGHDSLHVYTDGEFEILNVYITYLRYPKKIDKIGYIRFDGQESTSQDCELPYYAKQDIVDLAAKFALQQTENFPASQGAEDRIIKNTE